MKKLILLTGLMVGMIVSGSSLLAADEPAAAPAAAAAATAPAAPALKEPNIEQRLADLEAYVNNGARSCDAATNISSKIAGPGPGHNAWMMTSSALVLFMTLPGLALFYGGLVRRKNVLSVLAQCLGITGLVAILWWVCGYSLVFARGSGGDATILGSLKTYAFLNGVDSIPNKDYASWVSHNVFSMYQMMFAIITPALIVGAIAERMKFSAILLFVTLWMFVVYFPLAHMIWGVDGYMNGVWNAAAKIKAIDFAGGTVVHMSSGWSALILCIILGKRIGFGKEPMPPHSMVLCMVGTGMLWVGWYGFNAGSAVAADSTAANAFITTTMATAVASFAWGMAEYVLRGKPSVLGFCSGAVAGLVVITPACGFVNTTGAMIIGVAAGLVPFFAVWKLKAWFGYDDALDTFGVHAVGGTMGAFLTGILAVPATLVDGKINPAAVNANLASNVDKYIYKGTLWLEQLKAMGLTIVMAVVGTVIIAYIVKAVVGLRPTPEVETAGLDLAEHGEEGYHGEGAM
ncbi:ammonium transporter [Pedosphaera parvula]|uniref:Ammonium transporter n=1 Tax=Pedosphaera parvula (strain Ellin514) TaxID=320771 RepID=B9XJD7_PEDPL|nr:ammonium transporter [Pedosphaera parvula]EEF59998.1 ammonium transporter [Pedosphaera parvula Ellin514]